MSYTKPELRERIKSRVMAGGDGGKPGQWSARKAQLVAQKYEAAGGGYSGAKTEGQKSLSKWTKQKWTTSDGKPAERKGGTTRYLPEKAWDKLSPGERAATNAKKREGSREGKQFVQNTEAAAEARKEAMYKFASEGGAWQRSEGKNPEGGLNAKGRASLKAQGHDIKPGVKGPADTPEKQRRKGSFLSRMFGPGAPGSMKQDNGEPSRRALSAKAWGEPVPSDDAGRARLYAKGQALLKKYDKSKDGGAKKEAAIFGGPGIPETARDAARSAVEGAIAGIDREKVENVGRQFGQGVAQGAEPLLGQIPGAARDTARQAVEGAYEGLRGKLGPLAQSAKETLMGVAKDRRAQLGAALLASMYAGKKIHDVVEERKLRRLAGEHMAKQHPDFEGASELGRLMAKNRLGAYSK